MKAFTFAHPTINRQWLMNPTTGQGKAPDPTFFTPAQQATHMPRSLFGGLSFSSAGSGMQPVGTAFNMWVA